MGVKRYLLDSNAMNPYIDRGEPVASRVKDAIRRGCRIGTCEPVVAEMLAGLELSATPQANIARLTVLSRILPAGRWTELRRKFTVVWRRSCGSEVGRCK